jgi:hypothetical protein
MEHLARKYARKVGANWEKTLAAEVSTDNDLLPLLRAAPVDQLEVLVLQGSAEADGDRSQAVLSAQGVANLTLILEHNKTLKAFALIRNHLNLSKAMILCDSLRRLPALEIVSLSDNQMDAETAAYVLSELKTVSTLWDVNLAGNLFLNGPHLAEQLREEGVVFRLRY